MATTDLPTARSALRTLILALPNRVAFRKAWYHPSFTFPPRGTFTLTPATGTPTNILTSRPRPRHLTPHNPFRIPSWLPRLRVVHPPQVRVLFLDGYQPETGAGAGGMPAGSTLGLGGPRACIWCDVGLRPVVPPLCCVWPWCVSHGSLGFPGGKGEEAA